MGWGLLLSAILWWGAAEVIRGRPSCPGSANFALTFLGPVGAIILVLMAAFL